jgi:3-phosphoshikimate 1-carboxyvinyltransferase
MSAMASPSGALGLQPGVPLWGALRCPPSKSIAQRALLAAAFARGRSRIAPLPDGEDVRAALEVLARLGCSPRRAAEGSMEIDGQPPPLRRAAPVGSLDVGESGTAARLLSAALAFSGGPPVRVEARGSLLKRSSPPLFEALRSAGARVAGDGWPAEIEPCSAPGQATLEHPVSSQEVSALLLALAAWEHDRTLMVRGPIPSQPYVEITASVLRSFGAKVESEEQHGWIGFFVRGPLVAPPAVVQVERDASLAAVGLAAGCLSDGKVSVAGVGAGSVQGDVRIVGHLRAFGCATEASMNELQARGLPQHGASLDLEGEPDLAPVLAIVAASAALRSPSDRAWTELRGLGTLPGKESSRIEVLARGLGACGFAVESRRDRLRIGPPRSSSAEPVDLDPSGDHRMAFAFALLGLVRPGVLVRDPVCVAKSWPTFWDDLASLGAQVARG